MFEAYKPFRNYLRQFSLEDSLAGVWLIAQHLEHDLRLPPAMLPRPTFWEQPTHIQGHVFPWDLDVLARELVLNAVVRGPRSLTSFGELMTAVSHIRRLDNEATKVFFSEDGDVMREMHRIAHRQFPWQVPPSRNSVMRYHRIFGRQNIAPMIEAVTGLTLRQTFLLAFAVSGHFLKRPGLLATQSYEELGISAEKSARFFERLAVPLAQLRETTKANVHFDSRWLYAWNPLRSTPLIRIDPAHPERLMCPLPSFLMRRITEGLFYDLASHPGFDQAFGSSFEAYVGEVLRHVCESPKFITHSEQPYHVGKDLKHGIDWILEDGDAVLFIECKTARLRVDAKVHSDDAALQGALDRLGAAIVQHYRNIADLEAGLAPWKPTGKPWFPLVVTLEDWWIFGPKVYGMLDATVRRQLVEAGMDPTLADTSPYTVASAAELEIAAHAIADVGIGEFMRSKLAGESREWAVSPFSASEYPGAITRAREMALDDTWAELTAGAENRAQ